MRTSRVAKFAVCVALVGAVGLPAVPASAGPVAVPRVPHVDGPVTGGIRTGRPWYATLGDPASYGYAEEEFFISGLADSDADADPDRAYSTRIHVLRPLDPADFNGTAVVEWANVSAGVDTYPLWATSSDHLVREGFAYVAISVQKRGVDALRAWDPIRYGSLVHPGDQYAMDIVTQAGRVLREQAAGDPDPMGQLDVQYLIATGASQSGGHLRRYVRTVHAQAKVFDGFVLLVVGGAFAYAIAPTLVVTSESETSPPVADGDRVAAWEVAGAPHVSYREATHDLAVTSRDLTAIAGITVDPVAFDRDDAEQYGERGGGPCPRNFMPSGYVNNAAISRMHDWIRTGVQPAPAPRFVRDGVTPRRDAAGNTIGGVRLPPVEVPIAAYNGERCDTYGDTIPFVPMELARRYPSHADYVAKMRAATEQSVADGYLMRADAEAMMARAEASSIGSPLVATGARR